MGESGAIDENPLSSAEQSADKASKPLTLSGHELGESPLQRFKRRMAMKQHTSSKTLTVACVAALALGIVSAAQAGTQQCSLATVAGTYGLTTIGSIPAIGPVSAVGLVTIDKSGNLSGSQTRSLNGAVADETFTGTATVNPDCSGTDVIQVFQDGVLVRTSTLNLIYDDNGRSARAIFTSIVLPNGAQLPSILTIDARRMFVRDGQ
jgi:hypothetical protein